MLLKSLRFFWLVVFAFILIRYSYTIRLHRILSGTITFYDLVIFLIFFIVSWLTWKRKSVELLKNFITTHKKQIIFSLTLYILAFETILKVFYIEKYPTFSKMWDESKFYVNDVPSLNTRLFEANDYLPFVLKKNIDYTITERPKYSSVKFRVQTNQEGYRFFLKNDGFEKDNIMFFGDSMTFGYGVNNAQTFPDLFGMRLLDTYNIYNYAVPGHGFAEYYLTFKKYAVKPEKTRLIVVGVLPFNDFANLDASSWDGKHLGHLPRTPTKRSDVWIDDDGNMIMTDSPYRYPILKNSVLYVFLYNRFIKDIKEKLRELLTDQYPSSSLYLKILSDLAKNNPLLILLLPTEVEYLAGEDAIKRSIEYENEIKNKTGAHVLNLYHVIKPHFQNSYIDTVHFNAKGNEKVAQAIDEFIIKNKLLPNHR